MQDDDTIELNEFKATLGRKDETFTKRLFQVFDEDKNGTFPPHDNWCCSKQQLDHVDFREFALGVSAFCERGTVEEKIKCTIISPFLLCTNSLVDPRFFQNL